MERDLSSLRFESDSQMLSETYESSRCSTCGEKFKTPLLAMFSSGYLIEEYYACPKCLSKVGDFERQKSVEVDEADKEDEKSLEFEDKMEETLACAHYLGYLKRRSKNTPIPEDCLTCNKMIECMSC